MCAGVKNVELMCGVVYGLWSPSSKGMCGLGDVG